MKRWTGSVFIGLFVLVTTAHAGPAADAGASQKRLNVRSFALNPYKRQLDGQWQGIIAASDGNIYFGSSSHSAYHGAAFFRYSPRTGQVKMLCKEITEVCGEDPEKTPQNKIHSPIVEADGWLYFATHYSGGGPGAKDRYPGSHLIGYEMATERFRDYGIMHSNFTVYSGVGVDPKRKQLFVFATPITDRSLREGGGSHLYRVDTRTGEKTDLGILKREKWGHCFWLFIDKRGDCWLTVDNTNGSLFHVKAGTDTVKRYEGVLPEVRSWREEDEVHPVRRVQHGRWWRWAQPLPDGDRCVFVMPNGGMLWTFDATRDIASGAAFTPVRHIGPTNLGMALGHRRVYYVQRAGGKRGHKASDHHLWSVSLDPHAEPAIVDHGLIVDQAERRPWRVPSLAVGHDDCFYMVGDWYLNPEDKGTDKATMRYGNRHGEEGFRELWRGQFFATTQAPPVRPTHAQAK